MYKAQIIKIQKVEKHPNADKLSLVFHNGMTFITALDQYQTGDLAIGLISNPTFVYTSEHLRDISLFLNNLNKKELN
jgi:hypothetical protein